MEDSECSLITNKCENRRAYERTPPPPNTHHRNSSALGSKAERSDIIPGLNYMSNKSPMEGEFSISTTVKMTHGPRTSEFIHPWHLGSLSSLGFLKHSTPSHSRLLPGWCNNLYFAKDHQYPISPLTSKLINLVKSESGRWVLSLLRRKGTVKNKMFKMLCYFLQNGEPTKENGDWKQKCLPTQLKRIGSWGLPRW